MSRFHNERSPLVLRFQAIRGEAGLPIVKGGPTGFQIGALPFVEGRIFQIEVRVAGSRSRHGAGRSKEDDGVGDLLVAFQVQSELAIDRCERRFPEKRVGVFEDAGGHGFLIEFSSECMRVKEGAGEPILSFAQRECAAFPVEQKKDEIDNANAFTHAFFMNTVTATKARGSLYSLIDEANSSHEPIQITGKRGNAVLISEDDWRSIQETLYLQSIPGMVESIKKARKEGNKEASRDLDW